MIRIYTGESSEILKDIIATYEYPEFGLSPEEQFKWMDDQLEEIIKPEIFVSIKTFSPYILRYLDRGLEEGIIPSDALEAFFLFNYEEGKRTTYNMKYSFNNPDTGEPETVLDVSPLLDPITLMKGRDYEVAAEEVKEQEWQEFKLDEFDKELVKILMDNRVYLLRFPEKRVEVAKKYSESLKDIYKKMLSEQKE